MTQAPEPTPRRAAKPSLPISPADAGTPVDAGTAKGAGTTVQPGIPARRSERDRTLRDIRAFVTRQRIVPPISLDDLRSLTDRWMEESGLDPAYTEYAAVLLHNELWRDELAKVPFERRLLLLPRCLRDATGCPAEIDELGLLCQQCGRCSIGELQSLAESLGYAVLVAEGTPVVMRLIETGGIDAIVGVSCLKVLEKAFPYMESSAVPGMAIPLLRGGCQDTTCDDDWVAELIHLASEGTAPRLDLAGLRREVDERFTPEGLARILGAARGDTARIGHEWLTRGGKRWRPLLTVATHRALRGRTGGESLPAELEKVALAVECFHKASLVHDDIEDQDATRYGRATLHEDHGIPIALNVGDWLLGKGYRLIAECALPASTRAEMLRVASIGHSTLSLGQGAELCWTRTPRPLSREGVLEIFRQKTAPAFDVALQLGAISALDDGGAVQDPDAGAELSELRSVLERYSRALGVAYQIRDDLLDLRDTESPSDLLALRPTLPLALAWEAVPPEHGDRRVLEDLWRRRRPAGVDTAALRRLLERSGAIRQAHELLATYRREALAAISGLGSSALKGLLQRVVGRIFRDLHLEAASEPHGDPARGDAPRGTQGPPPAA